MTTGDTCRFARRPGKSFWRLVPGAVVEMERAGGGSGHPGLLVVSVRVWRGWSGGTKRHKYCKPICELCGVSLSPFQPCVLQMVVKKWKTPHSRHHPPSPQPHVTIHRPPGAPVSATAHPRGITRLSRGRHNNKGSRHCACHGPALLSDQLTNNGKEEEGTCLRAARRTRNSDPPHRGTLRARPKIVQNLGNFR